MSKVILKYIKDNQLQNPQRRKEVIPDAKLTSLLNYNIEQDGPLEYNKIQKLIGRLLA